MKRLAWLVLIAGIAAAQERHEKKEPSRTSAGTLASQRQSIPLKPDTAGHGSAPPSESMEVGQLRDPRGRAGIPDRQKRRPVLRDPHAANQQRHGSNPPRRVRRPRRARPKSTGGSPIWKVKSRRCAPTLRERRWPRRSDWRSRPQPRSPRSRRTPSRRSSPPAKPPAWN